VIFSTILGQRFVTLQWQIKTEVMKKVAVVGAGTMGNGIAHVFAQQGFDVSLIDVSPAQLEKAAQTIRKNFDRQIAKGTATVLDKDKAMDRIHFHQDMNTGLQQAALVVEAATENMELKIRLFKQLDQVAPAGCILASNTSSISITRIAAATKRPGLVIGMHFMNPVPVMKLVEVINGYATEESTTSAVQQYCHELQKIPCVVNDYPGFVANRILMPMLNESIYCLFQGVAGVEQIDTVIKLGLAHPMGPLQLADFIGLDICHAILSVMHEGFGDPKYAPCPLLTNMVNAGFLGIKTGEGFYLYRPGSKDLIVSPRFSGGHHADL
jgi:3-hydroxybutyryl-CoA dehydrogenase